MAYLSRSGVVLFAALFALIAHADLQQELAALEPGSRFELPPQSLPSLALTVPDTTVICAAGTVIDAGGKGHGVEITAPGITLRGCEIRNWGSDLNKMDAGIFVAREARGAVVQDNRLNGPAFGIWLDATPEVTVRNNRVRGDAERRSQDRGNGIHMFNTSGALIEGNDVRQTRDGIYIETSNGNTIRNNTISDLRYGVHYMYSMSNVLEGNHTFGTRTGYALMQSKHLTVTDNRSENDENYGILMNYITNSTLRNNRVTGITQRDVGGVTISGAEGKAVFIYNSLYNTFENNLFANSDIGIHLTAGSENNELVGNAFLNNERQVKYVANRTQEWSKDGRGNYWSDYLGWDRDQDGLGDVPYEPNDNVDRLLWTYPEARILMHSPAVDTLRWVQQAFPVVKAPGVTDSFPLMRPPETLRAEIP